MTLVLSVLVSGVVGGCSRRGRLLGSVPAVAAATCARMQAATFEGPRRSGDGTAAAPPPAAGLLSLSLLPRLPLVLPRLPLVLLRLPLVLARAARVRSFCPSIAAP